MTILLIGLNYKTAPLDLRERLYLTGDYLHHALVIIHGEINAEIVILSTCNRLEIYASTADTNSTTERIIAYLVDQVSLPAAKLQAHLHNLTGTDAVRHLMRVAAGLESLVFGETEVLGQIAGALKQAQQASTTGAVLSRLFQDAIHAGKRARTETAISRHTLSISHAAVLMAKQQIPDLSSANTLVIGAGRMAELAARALKAHGVQTVRVMNRTSSRAHSLANRIGLQVLEWRILPAALSDVDVVITATSAPQPILTAEDILAAHHGEVSRSLILVDIALPRNVNHNVRDLQNVRLYDIDDLRTIVDDHRAQRQSEAAKVETIIAAELDNYLGWLNSLDAVPTIVALRQKAEELAATEVERAFQRLPDLDEHEREVLTQMALRIVNKIIHAPTAALRERASEVSHYAYLHAVRQLFDLETDHE